MTCLSSLSTSCVQSMLSVPTPGGIVGRTTTHVALPSLHFQRSPKNGSNSSMRVQCMPENSPDQTPPQAPKMSPTVSDLLAFSGPAPERINGRLAMLGFVSAIAAELTMGEDVAAQLANGGLNWFIGTTLLLSLASLVPLLNGVTVESKSKGLMTSDAEMWNGRFAMLGLVALVFTEFVKGGALV